MQKKEVLYDPKSDFKNHTVFTIEDNEIFLNQEYDSDSPDLVKISLEDLDHIYENQRSKQMKLIKKDLEQVLSLNLTKKYSGKYLAIWDRKIIASGSTSKQAYERAKKKYPASEPTLLLVAKNKLTI